MAFDPLDTEANAKPEKREVQAARQRTARASLWPAGRSGGVRVASLACPTNLPNPTFELRWNDCARKMLDSRRIKKVAFGSKSA